MDIKPKDITVLKDEAGNYVASVKAEDAIVALKVIIDKHQDKIKQANAALDEIKETLKKKGRKKYKSNFSAINSRRVSISWYDSGAAFIAPDMAKIKGDFKKITESLDGVAVRAYFKEHGQLPKGIARNESRTETCRITIRE